MKGEGHFLALLKKGAGSGDLPVPEEPKSRGSQKKIPDELGNSSPASVVRLTLHVWISEGRKSIICRKGFRL